MTSSAPPDGRAFVFGANHRSSGLSLRDRLFIEDAEAGGFLQSLAQAGIRNALVLSTCDRVEVLGVHGDPEGLPPRLMELMARHADVPASGLADKLYLHRDVDAVRHLFAVAASLDSLVVGEPQVLGQLKAAHKMARDLDMVTGRFEGLLQHAYKTAKRVRTETCLGERPVSIASAACEIARGVHGQLSRTYVAMIGVGEMGELMARQFKEAGAKGITILHPSAARAEPVARRLASHTRAMDEVGAALAEADIVLCAMGRRQHVLSTDMVRSALKTRKNRPQLIIDTGVPGDVEPAVNRIDEAFVFDLADLERVAQEGQQNRQSEVEAAFQIVDGEVAAYLNQYQARDAAPAISQLRFHAEALRDSVLEQHPNDAARATDLLIARLLHHPTQHLRQQAAHGKPRIDAAEQLLRDLFGLDKPIAQKKDPKENDT